MKTEEAVAKALALVNSSSYVTLATVTAQGSPAARAMTKIENEVLGMIWFATSIYSRKVAQIRGNPSAAVCFADPARGTGVALLGEVDILEDAETKHRYWRPGFRRFFPGGPDDPSYCVLRFRAKEGSYNENGLETGFGV